MATYTYSIAVDFTNLTVAGVIAPAELHKDIVDSSINDVLVGVHTEGDTVKVEFETDLDGTEQTTLDGLVAAHTGETPEEPPPSDGINYQYSETETQGSTTATTWQEALSFETDPLSEGQYKIEWYAEVYQQYPGQAADIRVSVDGTVIAQVRYYTGNQMYYDYHAFSGIKRKSLLDGAHTLKIEVRNYGEYDLITYVRKRRIGIMEV